MTCIAGFVDRGVAYIGADSCVSYGENHRTIQSGRKLMVKDDYLLGLAGELRFHQLLQYAFTPPQPPVEVSGAVALHDYLTAEFIPDLRKLLKEYPGIFDPNRGQSEAEFLLSIRGHIFEIGADLSVCRPDDLHFGIGSGARVALGALHATAGASEPASVRMTRALRAAAHYDKGCAPPFFWGWTDPGNPPKIQALALS